MEDPFGIEIGDVVQLTTASSEYCGNTQTTTNTLLWDSNEK